MNVQEYIHIPMLFQNSEYTSMVQVVQSPLEIYNMDAMTPALVGQNKAAKERWGLDIRPIFWRIIVEKEVTHGKEALFNKMQSAIVLWLWLFC